MMKGPKGYFILFLYFYLIPTIIGLSASEWLADVFHYYKGNLIAGVIVCLLSASIVTWIPVFLLSQEVKFYEKSRLFMFTIILWILGFFSPILATFLFDGVQQLGLILAFLMFASSLLTHTKLEEAFNEISKDMEKYRNNENS